MTRRNVTCSTALHTVLDRAASLNGEQPPRPGSRPVPPADPTAVLVEAGWFVLQQLQIALGLTMTELEADRLVPDVLDRAASYGIASARSVGAAASIVDRVRTDDPATLARAIAAARQAFGDAEVIAGACALIAALTAQIAHRMALDPGIVHDELSGRVPWASETCTPSRPSARRVVSRRACARRATARDAHRPSRSAPLPSHHR